MSFTYLIIFEFPPKDSGLENLYTSYLIPNTEISYDIRKTLQEMQNRGQLDIEDYARPDPKKFADTNAVVLFLFENSDYANQPSLEKSDKRFVIDRTKVYQKFYSKEFEGVGKWKQYKRKDKMSIEQNITAIYELVDNIGFY